MDIKGFWERLDIALIKTGVRSIKALCKETGVPYQTIVNQRTQKRFPTVETVAAFAQFLDVSLDWLLLGKETEIEKNVAGIAFRLKEAVLKGLEDLDYKIVR